MVLVMEQLRQQSVVQQQALARPSEQLQSLWLLLELHRPSGLVRVIVGAGHRVLRPAWRSSLSALAGTYDLGATLERGWS